MPAWKAGELSPFSNMPHHSSATHQRRCLFYLIWEGLSTLFFNFLEKKRGGCETNWFYCRILLLKLLQWDPFYSKKMLCDSETMEIRISTVSDILLISKEVTSTKLDAIALLVCIAEKILRVSSICKNNATENHRLCNEKPTVTQLETIGYAAKNQRFPK